ncbi:MAG: ATP phosphoribosyltransferase [Nitrososphaerota archaeon]
MGRLRFAIPKGSLENDTLELLRRAFYDVKGAERTYRPVISDKEIELKILRPQEIPIYVAEGYYDVGITGLDWVEETSAKVEVLKDLEYGRVRLVMAAPIAYGYKSLSDLLERRLNSNMPIRISTEYLNITAKKIMANEVYQKYFGEKMPMIVTPWIRKGENPNVCIFLSFGATEAKPPEEADAIVDNTETGRTLEQNNLTVIEEFMTSTAILIANKDSMKDPWKKEKILDILSMFTGVLESKKRLHIFLNVKEENLEELLSILPALKAPTINKLSVEGWYAVNTVIEKEELFRILPKLRRIAQGLVAHEPQLLLSLEEILQGGMNGEIDKS